MFSYKEEGRLLEKEVADEAIQILRQKEVLNQEKRKKEDEEVKEMKSEKSEKSEKQEKKEGKDDGKVQGYKDDDWVQMEMEELQKKSKQESKSAAKKKVGGASNTTDKEINELLMQEWDKTAKNAGTLIK